MPIFRSTLNLLLPYLLLFLSFYAATSVQSELVRYQHWLVLLPYVLFIIAAGLGAYFNRSRITFLAAVLAIGLWALTDFYAGLGKVQQPLLLAMSGVLLPLNIVWIMLARDRPVFSIHCAILTLLIAAQLAVAHSMLEADTSLLPGLMNYQWSYWPSWLGQTQPQLVYLCAGFTSIIALVRYLVRPAPVNNAFVVALLTVLILALSERTASLVYLLFLFAAVVVLVSLVQDAYNKAYRDELTGLPGRRALNEYLPRLGKRYCVAMVDVDHFKKFNDTYGHDVGDQVLKMVAHRLLQCGGGSKAFRYGGEEFTLIFAGKSAEHSKDYLEELGEHIATYPMRLRQDKRPRNSAQGAKKRRAAGSGKTVNVTVSIGVAERNERHKAAQDVIKAADQQLYKAKAAGRNCVKLAKSKR